MKIVIAALFEEIEMMFENYEFIKIDSSFELYWVKIEKQTILVGCCGIGKVNAAMFTQYVINKYQVEQIISIGAAGSLNKKWCIGDVVVAKELIYGDVDVRVFGYSYGQVPQMPKSYAGEEIDLNQFNDLGFKVDFGTIVTIDSFCNSYDKKFDLLQSKDAIEMESCAIAQTAYINKVKFCAFRCISDNSFFAKNAANDYELTKPIIANHLEKVVIKMVGMYEK